MRFALVNTPRWVLLGLSLTMVLPTLVAAQDGTIAGTVRDDATTKASRVPKSSSTPFPSERWPTTTVPSKSGACPRAPTWSRFSSSGTPL